MGCLALQENFEWLKSCVWLHGHVKILNTDNAKLAAAILLKLVCWLFDLEYWIEKYGQTSEKVTNGNNQENRLCTDIIVATDEKDFKEEVNHFHQDEW